MANPENLTAHQFTRENQPKKRRSRKGIPNRATVLKKWLNAKTEIVNPKGERQRGTAEDEIVLALIRRAKAGNVPAIKEILDTVYGKQTETNLNITPEHLQSLSDEDLNALLKKLGYQPLETISEFKARAAERMRQIAELDDDGP